MLKDFSIALHTIFDFGLFLIDSYFSLRPVVPLSNATLAMTVFGLLVKWISLITIKAISPFFVYSHDSLRFHKNLSTVAFS